MELRAQCGAVQEYWGNLQAERTGPVSAAAGLDRLTALRPQNSKTGVT